MSQTISLDAIPGLFMPVLYYSQGDIGRDFVIRLANYSIPAGASIVCQATKPSGFGFSVAASYVGNTVTVTTTEAMTDEAGRFLAELVITDENEGTVIGTANFLMQGEASPHPDGTVDGQQGSIVPTLTALVTRIEDAADSIHALSVAATTLAVGSDATATYDTDTNTITFGIPSGGSLACADDGDGNVTITFS